MVQEPLRARATALTLLGCVLLVAGPAIGPTAAVAAASDTALLDAVKRGDRGAVRTLIREGADVGMPEADGTTALHWAVRRDDLEIARDLVAAGAEVGSRNRYEVPPLTLACINGSVSMTALLLSAGADATATTAEGETALMTAARSGVNGVVDLLLRHGADVNAAEAWRGQTALMWASAEGHADVVSTLLAHGADVSAASGRGFTALLFAAREGHIPVVERLLDAGASLTESLAVNSVRTAGGVEVRPTSDQGLNAFLLAVENAHYELAAVLLRRGADPNAAPRGWTALHQVSWVRKTGVAGSNNPAPEGSGDLESLEFVRLLVRHGADLNARVTVRPPAGITSLNMIGGTPFLLAARTADAPLMRLLAELGADTRLPNEDNTTPLMVAAGVGTSSPGEDPGTEPEVLEAVQVALELGGDLDAVDDNGETAMHGAAYKHVPSVVTYLADRGASIDVWNRENRKGWTPLEITEGVHRGMNIIRSEPTAAAVRAAMANAAAPFVSQSRDIPAGHRTEPDIVYGMHSGLALLLDAHYPTTPNGYGIIFIAGSGWSAPLDRDAVPLKENPERDIYAWPLVEAGYTVFAINHRAAPRFHYPAAVEDAQRAVRFVRHHAERFGIDADRIGAMGGSSGGHLASLLGLLDGQGRADTQSAIEQVSAKVQAVVVRGAGTDFRSCCGPDFPPRYVEAVSRFLGHRLEQPADRDSSEFRRYAEASPIVHVSPDDPPILMLHGELDEIVPIEQAARMETALSAAGVPASVFRVPGGGHDDTFDGVLNPPDYVGAMIGWFDRYLRGL